MSGGSLRLRLLIVAALAIAGALSLSGMGLSYLFEHHVERRVVSELSNHVRQLSGAVETGGPEGVEIVDGPFDPRFEQPLSGLYWQVTRNGKVVDTSRSLWDETLILPLDDLAPGQTDLHTISGPSDAKLYVLERVLTLAANGTDQQVRIAVAIDHKDIDVAVGDFRQEMFYYLAMLWIFLMLAAWAQVTLGLSPLGVLHERLGLIRSGQEKRLVGAVPLEVAPLTDELNALLAEQEQSILRARTRAGELAHGLKTPLTVLGGTARELFQRGQHEASHELSEQVEAMRRHVERELARARIAVGGGPLEPLGLRQKIEALVATMQKLPGGAAIEWSIEVDEGIRVQIDRADLAELLGNLLDNARKWSRGRVKISARAGPPVSLCVEDDGPGIPDGQRERMLGRGQRLDPAGTGSGLGLAIVGDIADAYGFQLSLAASALGGLAVRIELGKGGVSPSS